MVFHQSVCEIGPVRVDVVDVNTHSIMKHWNEISLYRSRILPTLVIHIANVSTYVKTFREVDYPSAISFDISSTTYSDPTDALTSFDEIEGKHYFFYHC